MSKRIDFGGSTWSAFPDDHWLEFCGNPNFPDYLRIVFVAYARHASNGHARLNRGELARYLLRKDGTLPDRRNMRHSIDHAISLGYLLPESRLLCLVVSSHHVQGGVTAEGRRCDRDHTVRRKDVTGQRRSTTNDVNETGRSSPKDVNGQRRSRLSPSLSSSSAQPPTNRQSA